jgi:hypothetical protein
MIIKIIILFLSRYYFIHNEIQQIILFLDIFLFFPKRPNLFALVESSSLITRDNCCDDEDDDDDDDDEIMMICIILKKNDDIMAIDKSQINKSKNSWQI